MKAPLSPSDLFEIRKVSLISPKDYEYALDLYAPLIGVKNTSVYLALVGEKARVEMPISYFLSKYRLSCGELEGALSYLEAVGLIASYFKKGEGSNQYAYAVMAPRTPAQFFSNELLYGTLRSYLSEEDCQKISNKYQTDAAPDDYENVSERFPDVFHLNFDDGTNIHSGPMSGERRYGALSLGFDNNAFASALAEKNPNIQPSSITRDEIVRIARIATLYSFEESAMASFVAESYIPRNPLGSKVDFSRLNELALANVKYDYLRKKPLTPTTSEIHGDEATSRVIRLIDSKSAIEFLTIIQRGNKPAPSDLKLINTLVTEMGVPENVANALIFYVLKVQDNTLTNAYVTKLGASLVRANITNALDALNYLGGHSSRQKKKNYGESATPNPQPIEETTKKPSDVVNDAEEDVDEDEFEEMMKNRGRK